LRRLPIETTKGDAPLRRRSIDIRVLPTENPVDAYLATLGGDDDEDYEDEPSEEPVAKFTTTYVYNGHEIVIRGTFKDYKMALGPDIR
jgi:hypothetical protein